MLTSNQQSYHCGIFQDRLPSVGRGIRVENKALRRRAHSLLFTPTIVSTINNGGTWYRGQGYDLPDMVNLSNCKQWIVSNRVKASGGLDLKFSERTKC